MTHTLETCLYYGIKGASFVAALLTASSFAHIF